ncbi:MAG: hypothetical protein FD168_447 [Desulfobulbaceae bacterium]|jgi:hypothetical protein|nr:MAG: hypothetical protein FD168_447 [Desulfobulbaceae bacterium]
MNEQIEGTGIGGWIGKLWQQLQSSSTKNDQVTLATEHVVEIADPVIRQARRYRQVLRDPIAGAMTYFQSLTEVIPGPVVLHRNRYYDDPLVKALFASPDELEEVLRLSPEVNALRQQGHTGEVVAMMTMVQNERTIFGSKQEGEMLLREVQMQAVSFSSHRVVAPAGDLEVTKTGIVERGLEVLASVAMEKITTLRARKAELTGKREYLKGMAKIYSGKSYRQAMFAPPDIQDREELRKIEQLLDEANREFEELQAQIALPEQSLGYLEAIMREPDKMLFARTQSLRLNWMGVRVDNDPDSKGNDIRLAEFSLQEELRRSAVLVSFSLDTTPAP